MNEFTCKCWSAEGGLGTLPGSSHPPRWRRGTSKLSTWDPCVHELRVKGCRIRIRRIPRSDCIYVREYLGGRVLRDFSMSRIETRSQMNKAGVLDQSENLSRLRALRPKGATEKIRRANSEKVRVNSCRCRPGSLAGAAEPFLQWVFATIATYGLRPHELGHAEGINSSFRPGWLLGPAGGSGFAAALAAACARPPGLPLGRCCAFDWPLVPEP